MHISSTLAWIGTGPCDPNKDLMQSLIALATIAGWIGVAFLLRSIYRSNRTKGIKFTVTALILVPAIALTLATYAITAIAYACSG